MGGVVVVDENAANSGDEITGGDRLVVAKSRSWCGWTNIAVVAKPGESGWKLRAKVAKLSEHRWGTRLLQA